MANNVLLFPTLTDELRNRIRYQKKKYAFYYTDDVGDSHDLIDEPIEAFSSVYLIKDEEGRWTQECNIGFTTRISLRTYQCLFGEKGIACLDATLGIAIAWMSSDSKQRGMIPVCTFSNKEVDTEQDVDYLFGKAMLRGEVTLSTILYIAEVGAPRDNEAHLANQAGYVLGELDRCTIRLDGTGSLFPIFEVNMPGQPLWYIACEWSDPTTDSLSECVRINLNRAHKCFKYIDKNQPKTYDILIMAEIMASAVSVIVEKVRPLQGVWDQIVRNDGLEDGSVGKVLYYFMDTLEWDMDTPESVAKSARKFFDKKL